MKTLVLFTLALLLSLASAQYTLRLISGNNQKGYAGDDTARNKDLSAIVFRVLNGEAGVGKVDVYYRQSDHLVRSKIFCVDPNAPTKTVLTSDAEGFVRCYPKVGFAPGATNITFSFAAGAPGTIISFTILPSVHVMGWIQIGLVFLITFAAIVFAVVLAIIIMVQPTGTEKMKAVANAIRDGANGFMKTQYLAIALLSVPVAVIVFLLYGVLRDESPADAKLGSPFITAVIVAVSFMLGVICSGIAGFVGMWVSVRANLRVAAAAASKSGAYNKAVRVAMLAGAFAGFLVVALSVLGVCTLFTILYLSIPAEKIDPHQIVGLIVGYGFGASFCALFAQLGGGIFTKAADVGADLCGKVVAGLPEDDLRNPAVIADLVGDNVGDCAGRGADLFESIAAENIGAMILAGTLAAEAAPQISTPIGYIIFPLVVHCFGMIATSIALLFVHVRDKRPPGDFEEQDNQVTKPLLGTAEEPTIQAQASPEVKEKRQQLTNPMWALGLGMVVASIIALGLFVLACWWCLHTDEYPNAWWMFLLCGIAGIVTSFIFCLITIFYTDYNFPPVRSIIQSSKSGPATNVIAGIAVGLESTAAPVLVISLVIVASYYAGRASGIRNTAGTAIGGLFGTAVATMGMLSTATYILAMDVFGPITDNAGGIVEMSKQPESVRVITDTLDAAGNTTKALTKGYAIGSAALASFLLFSAFMDTITAFAGAPFTTVDLAVPEVFVGALLGAMLVFLFSSLAIRAVGNAAETVIREVQRQFETIEGIRDYDGTEGSKGRPDYDKCVQIVTRAGLVQMILPGLLAITVPTVLGFLFRLVGYLNGNRFMGPSVVAGFLMVATITGILMALFLNNAGGAWDNSKKAVELISDEGKGSATHKAAVIGDTVGDPFKDTAGPSIHVLIKLLATVTLVLGPMFLNRQ